MGKNNSSTIKTKSLCPECLKTISAHVVEEKGMMMLKKSCSKHGDFQDIYWSDAEMYQKFAKYMSRGKPLESIQTKKQRGCPQDCGICQNHRTNTILANLDVTNRCNQKCPICFANSATSGYVYEPTFFEIRKMMRLLRKQKPWPTPAIQFSGGEPTLRADLIEIIKLAKKMGFIQIQIATNGIMIARSVDYAKRLVDAGVNTIYLQFDGTKKEIYMKTRGYNALPNKLKTIESCRKAGLDSVVLVPTIAKGVNEDEIGEILDFAVKNYDVVKGVNFQPISFSGRIDRQELLKMRITIPDVLKKIEQRTNGKIKAGDFAAVPFTEPISRFVAAWQNEPAFSLSVHPHCGAGTYVFVDDGKMIPLSRFVDTDGVRELVLSQAKTLEKHKSKTVGKILVIGKVIRKLPFLINSRLAPKNFRFFDLLLGILKSDDKESVANFHRQTLFIGIMHFMDAYNFDTDRVRRCGIHYVTPDQRIIPFCSYNIFYREKIEKKFSRPLD